MRSTFLPFSRPDVTETEIDAVVEVLRSGWITTGRRATELEQAVAALTGCRHAVALSSATGGIHLTLAALGIGPGDEVITPALTWVSAPNLVVLSGATPVFVDVDRDHLMTTADLVAERITDRTRLIMPVHYAGATLDLEPLRRLASEHGIPLVEDAAHAIGSRYRDEMVGASGTAIFSFHAIKNVTTAEGGLFVSDDETLTERIRRLKFHGLGLDTFDRETQGRAPQAEVLEPGFKYNLPDLGAAIGLSQLGRLEEINAQRGRLAAHYRRRLAGVAGILPLGVPAWVSRHSWHLFIVRVDERVAGVTRDELMAGLKARNVGTGLHFRAVHLQRYYRERFGCVPGMLPATEWNSDRICSLPLFPAMTLDDVDAVVDAIAEVLDR